MKKLLYLLLALPLLAITACSNDDDYPDVRIGFTYSGGTEVDGTLYAVQGDTLDIDSVYCVPVNPSQKAIIGEIGYVFDGRPLGVAPVSPFPLSLLTSQIPLGNHALRLQMTVYQEGKSAGIAWLTLPVAIVEKKADIPSSATPPDSGEKHTFTGAARYDK